jgi:hypothetical protein
MEDRMNIDFAKWTWLLAHADYSRALAQAQFEWLATHDGGHGQLADYGTCAATDAGGNVFLVSRVQLIPGPQDSNVDIEKYSPSGALLWTRNFDLPSTTYDVAGGAAVASNGDLCIVGTGSNPGTNLGSDLFLLRYDSNGNLLWSLSFSGAPGSGADSGRALAFDLAGNIVVAGTLTDASGQTDMLVKAFTPQARTVGDASMARHGVDEAYDLRIDAAGAIFVAGVLDYQGAGERRGQARWPRPIPMAVPLQPEHPAAGQ